MVCADLVGGVHVNDMATTLAFLLANMVLNFGACVAYGNHYKVAAGDVEGDFITFDSGIALIALQGLPTPTTNRNIIKAHLLYVGILREMIKLRYNTTPIVIFKCNWIPPNGTGNISIRRDQYGFWFANFSMRQSPNSQPYTFPTHVKQVLFVDDPCEPRWNVVLHKDSRSTLAMGVDEQAMFGHGELNEDVEALHFL